MFDLSNETNSHNLNLVISWLDKDEMFIKILALYFLNFAVLGRDCYLSCDQVQITYDKQICYSNCDEKLVIGATVGSFAGLSILVILICLCASRNRQCLYFVRKRLIKKFNEVDAGNKTKPEFQKYANDIINSLKKSEFINNFYYVKGADKFTLSVNGQSISIDFKEEFLTRINFSGRDHQHGNFVAEGFFLMRKGEPFFWFMLRYDPYDLAEKKGMEQIIVFESVKITIMALNGVWHFHSQDNRQQEDQHLSNFRSQQSPIINQQQMKDFLIRIILYLQIDRPYKFQYKPYYLKFMLSFGDLKNNLQRLFKSLKQMGILNQLEITRSDLEQKKIKSQSNKFYLRILNEALTVYSTDLYAEILNIVPNLKVVNDKKFVQNAFSISRKILNVNPKITPQQFLQENKMHEKKVEFMADLCENIIKWEEGFGKNMVNKQAKNSNAMKNYIPQVHNSKTGFNYGQWEQNEDQDELQERVINVKPTQLAETLNHSFGRQNVAEKIDRPTSQPQPIQKKPNVFPKNTSNEFLEDQYQQQNFIKTTKSTNKHSKNEINQTKMRREIYEASFDPQPTKQQSQNGQYVSRQEFNTVLEMLTNMNSTINGLIQKFNNFQMNVNSWFNNSNARIVLLQQNVKMIKSNL